MPTKNHDWSTFQRSESEKAHKQEVSDLNAKIKKQQEVLAEVSSRLDVALSVKSHGPKLRPIVASPDAETEATAFAIAGDWHAEENVRSASVNGINEFNLTIADARVTKFFTSILRLVEIERNGTKVDTLVLALMGDLMTGYIHEELQESNGLSPTEAIIWLRDRILAGLRLIKAEGKFKRIIIPCCYGNHGRTTKKPRHATGAKNSYEWLLYKILAHDAQILGMGEVEWHVAESYHTFLDIYGKTVRLHHGDGLRYEGGIGGLTVPVEKAIASWNKARVADLDIFGHWHTQQQNPKWISNGSLIGYNAFSVAIKAPFEPPQQTFFLFDSKRGRTGTFPIFL